MLITFWELQGGWLLSRDRSVLIPTIMGFVLVQVRGLIM